MGYHHVNALIRGDTRELSVYLSLPCEDAGRR